MSTTDRVIADSKKSPGFYLEFSQVSLSDVTEHSSCLVALTSELAL